MEKVILFDCFGVIVDELDTFWQTHTFGSYDPQEYRKYICRLGDSGQIDENELHNRLSEITGVSAQQTRKEWYQYVVPHNDVIQFIKELKQKYKIYLLSNATSTYVRNVLKNNGIENLFCKLYVSADILCAKPDREYFEYVINDLNIPPQNTVFIDDNPLNIAAAKELGINTILYKNLDELKLQLKKSL